MKFLNKDVGRISEKVRDGKQVSEKNMDTKVIFHKIKIDKKNI